MREGSCRQKNFDSVSKNKHSLDVVMIFTELSANFMHYIVYDSQTIMVRSWWSFDLIQPLPTTAIIIPYQWCMGLGRLACCLSIWSERKLYRHYFNAYHRDSENGASADVEWMLSRSANMWCTMRFAWKFYFFLHYYDIILVSYTAYSCIGKRKLNKVQNKQKY